MAPPETLQSWRFGEHGARVADLGEADLLDALMQIAASTSTTPTGAPGDDAAIWSPAAGRDLAVSIDALVEGEDFRRAWLSPRRLGRRAFNVAASDMAAMGALPLHCVVTLCCAGVENADNVLDIQRGICDAATAHACAVIGGDVSATSGPLTIDICITGELPAGRALRRGAGRAGDLLAVTGVLGRAAAGLRLLQGVDDRPSGEPPSTSAAAQRWLDAQLDGAARIAEGRHLLDHGVLCAGDLSDGLLVDAQRTGRSSGCAVELWAASLPVDSSLRTCFSQDWLQLAAAGGEDFELLAAVAPGDLEDLVEGWPAALAPLTVVGRLTAGSGMRFLETPSGAQLALPHVSSRHFS